MFFKTHFSSDLRDFIKLGSSNLEISEFSNLVLFIDGFFSINSFVF